MTNQTAANLIEMLQANSDFEKSKNFQRFFKTGKGQYGEGDVFLGLNVPMTRDVVKDFKAMPLDEIHKLAHSKYHEARLAAMVLIVTQYKAAKDSANQKPLFDLYVRLLEDVRVNNWDLIDVSAPQVIGAYLFERDRSVLFDWVKSEDLWFRRAAIVGSLYFIVQGDASTTLKLCEQVLNDKHDLIHKASGWMLREVGKRCSENELRGFLEKNVKKMPRTMLRYSIERLPETERKSWLAR